MNDPHLVIELRRHERDYPSLVHGPLCGRAADEIERLRIDADRYRYLRNRPEDTIAKGGVFAGMTPASGSGGHILTEDDLDRAVDDARGA